MATVLKWSGMNVTPERLVPQVNIPGCDDRSAPGKLPVYAERLHYLEAVVGFERPGKWVAAAMRLGNSDCVRGRPKRRPLPVARSFMRIRTMRRP